MIIMLSQSRNLITKNNNSRNHFSKISFPNEFALDNIFFFYYFFFLLYKYDSRRMELSSIHEVIRPSSSLLEFSTLFRNLDPVCLWSLYMFDVRQLFFFSLSPFFYSWLLCNVVTLVLGAPRSKKCIIPPNRTGNKSSKAIDDEEPRKVGGNRVPGLRFFSSGSMLIFKRNSRYILRGELRCGWRDVRLGSSNFRFSSSSRWNNNKSWKCWFLNKNHAAVCILDGIFMWTTRMNRSSFRQRLSYPSRWKDRYACYSTPLSNL